MSTSSFRQSKCKTKIVTQKDNFRAVMLGISAPVADGSQNAAGLAHVNRLGQDQRGSEKPLPVFPPQKPSLDVRKLELLLEGARILGLE